MSLPGWTHAFPIGRPSRRRGGLFTGYLNSSIVVKTRLPSFIVTLASLFILRGLTFALSSMFTNRTIVSGVRDAAGDSFVAWMFGGKVGGPVFVWLAEAGVIGRLPNGAPVVNGIPMVIVWALVIAVVGHVVLTKTRAGQSAGQVKRV